MSVELTQQTSNPIAQRIVTAAAEHFVADGFEGASTASIAATAKTSKREIYARFGNKEGLFKEVMAYVCSLAGDTTPDLPDSFAAKLEQIAHAVLTRFLLQETRGVLVCALGASAKFPSIPELFWQEGPGQAVNQLASMFRSEAAREQSLLFDSPTQIARRYIFDCCGGFVLAYLFDAKQRPTQDERNQHIATVTQQLIERHTITA